MYNYLLTFIIFLLVISVSFNELMYSVNENSGTLQPMLILSQPSSTDITIQVITNEGTATSELAS